MELAEIVRIQIEADKRRGFLVEFTSDAAREDQLNRDVVGLIGEVGEFANLLKKVSLARRTEGYDGPSLAEASQDLREELVDATIYIMRPFSILDGNLEQEILAKMKVNDDRYRQFE